MNIEKLKPKLHKLYRKYCKEEFYKEDPIIFPKRFKKEEDIEVVGLIASSLAYGKVTLFLPVIEKILQKMGNSPSVFLENFDLKKDAEKFSNIYYRFSRPEDIIAFIYAISKAIKYRGRLKNLFMDNFNSNVTIKEAITGFVHYFSHIDLSEIYKNNTKPKGYLHFFPSPKNGSACKRINLFLRWMVRDRDIDFGIWKEVEKSKLIIPLDTHVARISRCLGLLTRNSADWMAAEELTNNLKRLDSADPLKYDFALCHVGIIGECDKSHCEKCIIRME